MTDGDCTPTGDAGTVVQIALAVLVAIVLLVEYGIEFVSTHFRDNSDECRSFRTFWFDSYKICAGALVSHIFNIGVAYIIDSTSTNADQCAVYALAFFYEACGVPFVQLLQYCLIQYSLRMANSEKIALSASCQKRWQYIAEPGIYGTNRYPVDDCIHCRRCQRDDVITYSKIAVLMLLLIGVSVGGALLGMRIYSSTWYVVLSIGFLSFIFLFSTAIAPISSLWQTTAWVTVKMMEKSCWTLFAMAQATKFAEWSTLMSTGNTTWDAWLFLAVIPIIMNAFMFFMFSRISRLKLPCFAPKYVEKLDKARQKNERRISKSKTHPEHQLLNASVVGHDSVADALRMDQRALEQPFDDREACRVGIVFMLMINSVLLLIATVFLVYQGRLDSIWILFLSMIVVPILCSLCCIWLFGYLINHQVDVCGYACCCGRDARRKALTAKKLSISLEKKRGAQGPLYSPSTSVQEVL